MYTIFKKVIFLISIILFTTPLFAQDSSLVGFWTFDDSTGVDSSIYFNDGTLSADPVFIDGMKGSAMYFDGVDDYVVVPDANSLDTDSTMTISLWIRPDSVNFAGSKVMSKWYSSPQQGDWLLSLSSLDSCGGTCVSYYFGFANYHVYGSTNGWFSIGPPQIDYFLLLEEWNFIAVTFDTGLVNLYYNGDLIKTDTSLIKYTSLNEYNTDDIYMGKLWNGYPGYYFYGGLDEVRIYNRALSPSEIYDLYSQVVATEIKPYWSKMPLEFKLLQNYPNPFNPTTTIKYSLTKLSFVAIKVFDVLGKEINTIENEVKAPGNYEIEFHTSNIPSGVYFYRLQAGDFVDTKKMLLLK